MVASSSSATRAPLFPPGFSPWPVYATSATPNFLLLFVHATLLVVAVDVALVVAVVMLLLLLGYITETGWDIADGGAQVVAGVEGVEDLIPSNWWLERVVLPGRVEFMRMPLGANRRPRTGNEEGAWEPMRFFVQIADQEDIAMLIIPPKFRSVTRQCLFLAPPRVVSLSTNNWCEFWVQV
ncbi:Protein transport protein Sec31A [Hordeum vulgare]|nr:Protein transport protein Sec31A [Hordeum vulgare]